jgi:hypothetical protein
MMKGSVVGEGRSAATKDRPVLVFWKESQPSRAGPSAAMSSRKPAGCSREKESPMRRLAHISMALLGLALAIPATALGFDDPPASSPAPHKHGLFHRAKDCPACSSAKAAQAAIHVVQAPAPAPAPPPMMLPEGSKITGCAHSANGVCAACRKILEAPGQIVMVAPGAPANAVAAAPAAAPGRVVIADTSDPMPVGLMRTDYHPGAPGTPGAPSMSVPANGRDPFMPPKPESKPHILSHLFGFADVGNDVRTAAASRDRKKREAHAAISYGENASKVEDLPASMVYGKK